VVRATRSAGKGGRKEAPDGPRTAPVPHAEVVLSRDKADDIRDAPPAGWWVRLRIGRGQADGITDVSVLPMDRLD
jgi:hypothetical protein